MSDDRSERLRNRRNQSARKAREANESGPVKPDKTEKKDKPEEDDSEEVTPAKERDDWGPIQVHLPDDLRDDLELTFDEANLELKKEGEEKLQKLLHYYPLIVSAGIDAIDEMDVDEIKDEATSFE